MPPSLREASPRAGVASTETTSSKRGGDLPNLFTPIVDRVIHRARAMPKVAVALHDWAAAPSSDEKRYLTFSKDDRIEIIEEREAGGWWAGSLHGKVGWFPSSFCRVEDLAATPAPPPAPPQASRNPLSDLATLFTSAPAAAPALADQSSSVRKTPSKPPPPVGSARTPGGLMSPPPAAASAAGTSLMSPAMHNPYTQSAPASGGVSGMPAMYNNFELPLTSAAKAAATAGRYAEAAEGDLLGTFGGGGGAAAGIGVSGTTDVDRRLQQWPMPAPAPAASASGANARIRPIWQSLAFIDLFADCAGGARAALSPGSEAPAGLASMRSSMILVIQLLQGVRQAGGGASLVELEAAENAFRLGIELIGYQRPSGEHAALLTFLEQLVPMVASIPVGGTRPPLPPRCRRAYPRLPAPRRA